MSVRRGLVLLLVTHALAQDDLPDSAYDKLRPNRPLQAGWVQHCVHEQWTEAQCVAQQHVTLIRVAWADLQSLLRAGATQAGQGPTKMRCYCSQKTRVLTPVAKRHTMNSTGHSSMAGSVTSHADFAPALAAP
jgi:hypothetical protein